MVATIAMLLPATAAAGSKVRDFAASAGISDHTVTWGATVHDFNGDGLKDIVIGRHWTGLPRLYRANASGTYSDATSRLGGGRQYDHHGCSWGDVQADGLPDLYCTTGGEHGGSGPFHPNSLFVQQRNGTFTEQARQFGVADWGRGRVAVWLDANRDGYDDLFVGNTFPRADGLPSENHFYLNERGRGFRPAPEWRVDKEIGAFSVQAGDYNGDRYTDLLLCGQKGLRLYRNIKGERFKNVTRSLAGRRHSCRQAKFARLGEGKGLAVFQLTKWGLRIHRRNDGFQRPNLYKLKRSWSFAVGDANSDGRPDVYLQRSTRKSNYADLLLVNRPGRWRREEVPLAFGGIGDRVATVPRLGRDHFLVLNGFADTAGPVALLAWPAKESD